MATKTMILRPTGMYIGGSSGSCTGYPDPAGGAKDYYTLVCEEVPDEDATYLTLTGDASIVYSFQFTPSVTGIIPTAIRVASRMRTTIDGSQGVIQCNYSGSFSVLTPIDLTEQYETYIQSIPSEYIEMLWRKLGDSTQRQIFCKAQNSSGSSKNTECNAIITQFYLEVDYEEPEIVMYTKAENSWLPIYDNNIYKKINGAWQLSTIDSESIQNKLAWEHYYLTFTELEDNTYSVKATDISKLPSTVYIPKTYNGKPVTVIEQNAFKEAAISEIIIPDGIKTIGESSFYNCTSISSIKIPDGVTSIGDHAFYNCDSLTSIIIPNSITSIGNYAFSKCDSLTSVEIGDSVTSIGDSAFCDCWVLISVAMPNSVTLIGDAAFAGCSALDSIVIPNSVISIGKYAFNNCDNLTIYCEVASQPESWNVDWNYSNCSIVWDYTATDISYFSFAELEDGRYSVSAADKQNIPDEIIIPSIHNGKAVTLITLAAFAGCSFTSVTIPDTVTEIALYAFQNCANLANLVIGNGVISIGHSAFQHCYSLTSITYNGTMEQWAAISFDSDWNDYVPATYVQCSDGQVAL